MARQHYGVGGNTRISSELRCYLLSTAWTHRKSATLGHGNCSHCDGKTHCDIIGTFESAAPVSIPRLNFNSIAIEHFDLGSLFRSFQLVVASGVISIFGRRIFGYSSGYCWRFSSLISSRTTRPSQKHTTVSLRRVVSSWSPAEPRKDSTPIFEVHFIWGWRESSTCQVDKGQPNINSMGGGWLSEGKVQ